MLYPRDGDRFLSIFDLRGLDNVTLRTYERHHLSGTPFNIHSALEVVTELVAVQMCTDSRSYDSDLLSSRIEEEVEDYLNDPDDEDGETVSPQLEIFTRMVNQSFRAIEQLYDYLSPVIFEAIEREYEFDINHMYFDVAGTELMGYSALSMCLEFSSRGDR
jgi:hypothetical protein